MISGKSSHFQWHSAKVPAGANTPFAHSSAAALLHCQRPRCWRARHRACARQSPRSLSPPLPPLDYALLLLHVPQSSLLLAPLACEHGRHCNLLLSGPPLQAAAQLVDLQQLLLILFCLGALLQHRAVGSGLVEQAASGVLLMLPPQACKPACAFWSK